MTLPKQKEVELSHFYDEEFISDLKEQTNRNTFTLSAVSEDIVDIKNTQSIQSRDHVDTKLLLHQCVNDIAWLKKIFWGLLVFSGGTFVSTFVKMFLSILQK